MADKNLVWELKRWATEEFNLPPDRLANDSYFKTLCIGTGKSIWKYVIHHVFQQRNVRIIRGNLQWYKVFQDKELKQAEGQSEAAKQRELQKKIEQLRSEISHLDSQISGTEEQLATQEQSVNRTWAQVEDSRRRELLLQAFRQRCSLGRTGAWEEVKQSLVELAKTRSRVQQLQHQLQACKKKAEQEVSGIADESHNNTVALSALEVELQCVMQAAARNQIRDRCHQLDQHARSRQDVLRNLHSQWQSILDFRQQVVLRQEHIRGLIKGNSTAKTELIRLHRELQEFVLGKLVPQFEVVTTAASSQRNSISKEARQLGTISLLALDCRTVDGMQRIPASWLSIHRLQSPTFSSLCQNLAFPLYRLCCPKSWKRIRSFWRLWYTESEASPNVATKAFLTGSMSKLPSLTGGISQSSMSYLMSVKED
ncbi:HAUS augmin-like complex subunit 5 [Liparis tanakae]|uniref:HAUS augmin-like complex subunit 5 n=1 Tax=Liparis tanakae TaxID=230148 RepID=A0A4Z2JH52_9TELE|nr:HAUS augmin-like complex subunit 5 [Liparis tanakae]